MDNSFTVIAALCAAVAAIIAPTITALITCVRDYKVKKVEYLYNQKLSAIKDFTSKYIYIKMNCYQHNVIPFITSANHLVALCKYAETRIVILELCDLLDASLDNIDKSYPLYKHCLELLAKETA